MKNYVVGDIQGCYKGLRKLLKKAGFRPKKDKLWAVGDLVARGPDSLSTLKYLFDLGPHFDTVLGNHDLHLIAIAYGLATPKAQDNLKPLIDHKHFARYIEFLLHKPLAVQPVKNTLISHAGLYPGWSIKKALKLSKEVQTELSGTNPLKFLKNMYGNQPCAWESSLNGHARNRFIVNAFTRMRYVYEDGSLDFDTKCHPTNSPNHLIPWYACKNKKLTSSHTLIFGHWASLLGEIPEKRPNDANIIALDTGFVWGNTMSLYCIESQQFFRYSE